MTTSRTRLSALLLVLALAAPASAQIPDAPTLLATLGFSQGEIQQVTSGQMVNGTIKAASDRELVASMAFSLPAAPGQVASAIKAGTLASTDPTLRASGKFSAPPAPTDLAKLTLTPDQVSAYQEAAPGQTLNLSAQEIATFAQLSGASAAQVTAAVRTALLGRLTAYQKQGLAGIAPYARESGTRSCSDEIRTMTEASKPLKQYVPSAYQMLLSYPNSKPAGTEEVFRWSQLDAHGTPVIALVHVAVVPDGKAFVVIQRMFYVSASFNCEQAIAALMPVQNGTVVVYGNRTSTDQVEGWGGSVKRSIGSDLLESQLESQFKAARQKVGQ